jgi:hypothetical protein
MPRCQRCTARITPSTSVPHVLKEIAACACGESAVDVVVAIVGREHDDARVGIVGEDGARRR